MYNKLYSITSKLHKTTSSIGFIKKALHNNVIPKFSQIKEKFVNGHQKFRQKANLCCLILTDMFVVLKIQIKTHYNIDALLILSVSEIRYKLLKKHLVSSLYQERTTSFNTKNKKLERELCQKLKV